MKATPQQLENRIARCHCGNTRPSIEVINNNFASYRGPGSMDATKCRKCGFYEAAHKYNASRVNPEPRDCEYEAQAEGFEFDSYWDGCGNTD